MLYVAVVIGALMFKKDNDLLNVFDKIYQMVVFDTWKI